MSCALALNLSDTLQSLASNVPCEFQRKPRSLSEIDRWKATEFRFFLLYSGPVVLKGVLPKIHYDNFLLLNAAMRILCVAKRENEKQVLITIAIKYLKLFLSNYVKLYGKDELIYNVHSILHLAEDCKVINLSSLDEKSCFPFENYLGRLIRYIRSPRNPLAQVVRRLSEESNRTFKITKCFSSNVEFVLINSNVLIAKNTNFKLNLKTKGDNTVILKNGKIIQINKLMSINGEVYINGHCYTGVEIFHNKIYNMDLIDIGIYRVKKLKNMVDQICVNEIQSKCIQFKFKDDIVVIKILHSIN